MIVVSGSKWTKWVIVGGAYNIARASAAVWRWSGVSHKTSTWIGGISSTAYLTVIEILDGHSAGWGWSWADMGANLFGSALFISQELGWKEQRLQFKFSNFQISLKVDSVSPKISL